MDQRTLSGLLDIGYYLLLYLSKYHVRRYYAPISGDLCDIPLDCFIQIPNKLGIVLVLLIKKPIKIHFHGFGEFLNNSSVDYVFCCEIVSL